MRGARNRTQGLWHVTQFVKKGRWKPRESLNTRVPAHPDTRKVASSVNRFLSPTMEENNFLSCSSLDASFQSDSPSPNSAIKIAGIRVGQVWALCLTTFRRTFLRARAGAGAQC